MRRWLYVWGPSLIGAALATGAGTVGAALGTAGHYVAMAPLIVLATVATIVSIVDSACGSETRRRRLDDVPCRACVAIDKRLAAVTKDRDELRAAILVLDVPKESKP